MLAELLREDEQFRIEYTAILNFINAIYVRLVGAYAKGDLTSIVNLRYIDPHELGDGIVGMTMRRLNNVLIFGHLLSKRRTM